MLNDIIHIFQIVLALFLFGFIVDYPEQKRKAKARELARKNKECESRNHDFTGWKFDYEIGYNDKDVYRRHCKHCKYKQFTISRLHPLDDEVYTLDKL